MDIYENKKIAIIGAGHMGEALLEGLLSSRKVKSNNVIISNSSRSKLMKIKRRYKVNVTKNNREAVIKADWIFITVKPLVVKEVLNEIKNLIEEKILFSLAAGVEMKILENYVGSDIKLVRLMPNIPISLRKGVIGVYLNHNISLHEDKEITGLLSLLGTIYKVRKEGELDVLTLVSACGPGIVAYFIDLLAQYGELYEISLHDSFQIALRTFEGTISYLKENNLSAESLIASVATSGGVTEAILLSFKRYQLKNNIFKSFQFGNRKIGVLKRKMEVA